MQGAERTGHSRLRRFFWHFAVTASLVLLTASLHLVDVLPIRLPLRTSPLVTEAVDRANDRAAVIALLGGPGRPGWFVKGYVRTDETGWGEARMWIPVSGPTGSATLYAWAGRGSGPWVFSALELLTGSQQVVNLLEPDVPSSPVQLKPQRRVYLVPLGESRTVSMSELPDYYRAKLGLVVEMAPAQPLESGAFDASRGQFVAEELVKAMKGRLPQLASDPAAVVIGITDADMYIRALDWRYAFGYRTNDRFAVISSARMTPFLYRVRGKEYLLHTRVRKMLSKYIGLMVYRLPPSQDPTSLLYTNIMGVDDLDLIRESFEGLGTSAVVSDFRTSHRQAPVAPELKPDTTGPVEGDGRYPCFMVRPGVGPVGSGTRVSAEITQCLPSLHAERDTDEIEVDLRIGMLVTRKTDLFVADVMPLGLTRCYRLWDPYSRAFGIGSNHPYDTFPVGSRKPYTYVNVILADGSAIHYDRISKGTGYADAVYEHTETATPFLRSRFHWNGSGWDLRFPDGALWIFPESYAARRAAEAAVIEMRDAENHVIRFERDRRRNLVRLTSPAGRFIALEYDSSNRIIRATEEGGRSVTYAYDGGGRLAAVASQGRVVRYSYDGAKLVAAEDERGRQVFRIRYNQEQVGAVTLSDGRTYQFHFVLEAGRPNEVAQAFVKGPDDSVTEIDLTQDARVRKGATR